MMKGEPTAFTDEYLRVSVSFSVCVKLFVNRHFVEGPCCVHNSHCDEGRRMLVYMDDSDATQVSPTPVILEDRRMTGMYELGYRSDKNVFAPQLLFPLSFSQPRLMAYYHDSTGREKIDGYKSKNVDLTVRQVGIATNMMLRSGVYDLRFSDRLQHANINTELSTFQVTKVITLSHGVKTLYGFSLMPGHHYLFVLDSQNREIQVERLDDDLVD